MTTNGSNSSDRDPRLISGLLGRRLVSLGALLERIEDAFIEEYADTPALADAISVTARLKLLNETISYVLAVESVQLDPADRAALAEAAYSLLFG